MLSFKTYFYALIIATTICNISHAHQAKLTCKKLTSLKNVFTFDNHPKFDNLLALVTSDGTKVIIYDTISGKDIITIPVKTKKTLDTKDWPQKFTAVVWLEDNVLAIGDNKAIVSTYIINFRERKYEICKTFEIFSRHAAPEKPLPIQKIEIIGDYWSAITGRKDESAWLNNIVFKKDQPVARSFLCCAPYRDSTIGSQAHLKRPARCELAKFGSGTLFEYLGLDDMDYFFRYEQYEAVAFYKPNSNIIILGKSANTSNYSSEKIYKELEKDLPKNTIVITKSLETSNKPQMCFFEMEDRTFIYEFEVKADITTLLRHPNFPYIISGNKKGLIEFWLVNPEQKEHRLMGEVDTETSAAIKKIALWDLYHFISLDEKGNLKIWKLV